MKSAPSTQSLPESPASKSSAKVPYSTTETTGLRGKFVRGGMITVASQGVKFVVRTGSVMVMARLLSPNDFGLQAMVFTLTGFLGMFRDAGLSVATVQRDSITHQQISTLFWINIAVGLTLSSLVALSAPALVHFYHEPRLYWITVISGCMFLFTGSGAQHLALLQRGMRYTSLATIDILSLVISAAVGIGMAAAGTGYWALVGMAVAPSLVSAAGAWIALRWMPGLPSRASGIGSMLHFGGTSICNSLVVYMAYNAEKLLLGRYFGADALGLYTRAFQLITLPGEQLNTSVNSIAFPTLARLQNEKERLSRTYLQIYSALLSINLPIATVCAVLAEEIVRCVLGAQWTAATPVFRLLAPTVAVFAMINPLGWILQATGRVGLNLKLALVIAPVVVAGIIAGIKFGPIGVAVGYSSAMSLLLVPVLIWIGRATELTPRAMWHAVRPPLLSSLMAGMVTLAFKLALPHTFNAFVVLTLSSCVFAVTYAGILLFLFKQKELYLEIAQHAFKRSAAKSASPGEANPTG